jgi:peptide-methionine (R)-S-oxide reductase
MNSRRGLLAGLGACGALAGASALLLSRSGAGSAAAAGRFEVERTDAEWRRLLTPAQYAVLRGHGTERAGSSPLDAEKRRGTFACAGCGLPLFSSATKFDSGTGWPSFWQPLEGAIGTSTDRSFFMTRTEVHCARCGGHLGHVFDDGPPPTGRRYCMNGIALTFEAAS